MRQDTNLASIQHRSYYLLKCQELNKMKLPTPPTVILLFLRMSPLGQATFSSVLVINEHSILATYQKGSHNFLQKLLLSFQSSCGISPHFKPKSDAGPLFLKLYCFLKYTTITTATITTATAHSCTQQSQL